MLTMILLSIILFLSVAMNLFLIWFAWRSLRQISEYDQELKEISQIMKNFTNHLKGVYEMEMFYGDETLRHLLRHSSEIVSSFENYDLLLEEDDNDDYRYESSQA
jgi:hypothetical protein